MNKRDDSMAMSKVMSRKTRFLYKYFPFLFEKCPHNNITRKKKFNHCYCMISSSDGSKWSFAIAIKLNNKWLALREIENCKKCKKPFSVYPMRFNVCNNCYVSIKPKQQEIVELSSLIKK